MKFARLLAFLGLTLMTLPVVAQNVYSTYHNARFGTVVQYPADLVVPQREADNGDGRHFVSRDGSVELSVYGFHNANNRSVIGEMNRARADWKKNGANLTYGVSKGNWYAFSGFIGSDIFYEKTLYKNGIFHTLIWQYPKAMRKQLDAPVNKSVRSFSIGDGVEKVVAPPVARVLPHPVTRAAMKVVATPRPVATVGAVTPEKGGY